MPFNPFELPEDKLQQIVKVMPPEAIRRQLTAMADSMGDAAFGAATAREIVARTRPEQAVPEKYARYRKLVRDGIEFFLSLVSRQRLIELVLANLALDPEITCQERLMDLAKRFPTLHKLGQLIARHPDLDPELKQWLIKLENGLYGTTFDELRAAVHGALGQSDGKSDIHVEETILAEASVGAVIPFHWQASSESDIQRGVFKVLRPGIRGLLEEELAILEKTATFFHTHRNRYPLKDLRFLEIFDDLKELMVHEIYLGNEQRYLAEAERFYADMPEIRIPQCLPHSTADMTAMSFLDGPKLADANLTNRQRRQLAETLFTALVLAPLFSWHDPTIFHGDPHAGNILAVYLAPTTTPAIGLVDWSLAGHLSRSERLKTVRLIQALLKKDLTGMCNAVRNLTLAVSDEPVIPREGVRDRILSWLHRPKQKPMPLVKQAFRLLEHLSMEGLVFPADLMLFRKAIFTLEGVLTDLWPAFDMDAAITGHLIGLFQEEFPFRLGNLFFPLTDRPENYKTLISNQELHALVAHQYINALTAYGQKLMAPLTE